MLTETKASQWAISEPAAKAGEPAVEIGRVETIEHSKFVTVRLPKQKEPIILPVEAAKDFGDALSKASELAAAPPTPSA